MDPSQSGNTAGAPQSLRDEGGALLRQGKFTEAVDVLTTAVEEDPSDETAWRLLGGALASSGDFGRAVSAFERAIKLVPSSARNYYNLALALRGLGRSSEALTAVEKSISLEPGYEPARGLLESLGGSLTPAAPALPVTPPAPPTPPAQSPGMGAGMGLGGITPIGNTPPPAAPPQAPPAQSGMAGLGSIGGGMPTLGAIGGGYTPPPAAPPPTPAAPGGGPSMGLSSVGGAGVPNLRDVSQPGAPPPPYASPAQPGSYTPGQMSGQPGGYTPGQSSGGAYVPPGTQSYGPRPILGGGEEVVPQRRVTELLVMAILGFFCFFGFFLAPYSWYQSNKLMQTLRESPNADQGPMGTLTAVRILGIIGTCLWVLGVVRIAILMALPGTGHTIH